jgi:hypothetical protein
LITGKKMVVEIAGLRGIKETDHLLLPWLNAILMLSAP